MSTSPKSNLAVQKQFTGTRIGSVADTAVQATPEGYFLSFFDRYVKATTGLFLAGCEHRRPPTGDCHPRKHGERPASPLASERGEKTQSRRVFPELSPLTFYEANPLASAASPRQGDIADGARRLKQKSGSNQN